MKIFVIMGRSASGKDTLYKKILSTSMNRMLSPVVTCTTRPMRPGETNGKEYYFVTRRDFEKDLMKNRVVESRVYNTAQGQWIYYTKNFVQKNEDRNYIVIGTPESFQSYRQYYGKDSVVPLYIHVDEKELLFRAFERERNTNRDFTEMCRRFEKDSDDFSEEKLESLGIDRRFVNDNLDRCFAKLCSYICDVLSLRQSEKSSEQSFDMEKDE